MANNDAFPLDDLTVFLAVAEHGGFRAAAKRLGRAPSTVSATVTRLEAQIGSPLFARTTRSVRPTEVGLALEERVRPLVSEARQALEMARTDGTVVRGPLRLNVPGAVMIDILPPVVDRFLARHPDVEVELVVDDRFVDAIAAGCHAGVRYDEALEQDMIAVPFGPRRQQFAVAAAPGYLERRGVPRHPCELPAHDGILFRFGSGALTRWELEQGDRVFEAQPRARLILSTTAVAAGIGHAIAGAGLIGTFRNWLEPSFADGRLVPVLQSWWPAFDGPKLYYPSRFMPSPLRAFVDLIREERGQS
ncbi:LysR family transcriptional regulator [Acuticoccus sp. I52.16.1]|uniref:LysR family transcriptional regulator n=1 Tax=Acuticoccus sp. I52.16.1 TaxID=2928472 RepID=UPI001FD5AD5F|nr:LysR family transcriptional regulator [Acuticoccus sp. I52.16.1]UOM32996.1 LysR family transcriptional regulator [Acuticoccus sp. I52.16.1]